MYLSKIVLLPRLRLPGLRIKVTVQSIYLPLYTSSLSTNASVELMRRKQTFAKVLPGLIDSLVTSLDIDDMRDLQSWIFKVLNYNLKGGKLLRGLCTVMAYELMEKPENITDESLLLSCVMGWCVEMFQAHGLMIDDMMDGSVLRRGVPCWHTLPAVGRRGINDIIFTYSFTNHALRTHFRHLPQYPDIVNLFNTTLFITSSGQHLDYTVSKRIDKDYGLFTMELYDMIAKYKTSYYSFTLPVRLGMLLANCTDEETLNKAEEITLKIGGLYQMQDDIMDAFKVKSVTGKQGTDIQEGKCTWLAVSALQRCNTTQREEFTECYASADAGHVNRIIRLYEDLDLPRIYKEEERRRHREVVTLAKNFGDDRASHLFLMLLGVIYDRNK